MQALVIDKRAEYDSEKEDKDENFDEMTDDENDLSTFNDKANQSKTSHRPLDQQLTPENERVYMGINNLHLSQENHLMKQHRSVPIKKRFISPMMS